MIIKECYIENFGKLSRFKKTFSEGFNVIVSENGWGKTTFSLFLRTMLFGMESKRAKTASEKNTGRGRAESTADISSLRRTEKHTAPKDIFLRPKARTLSRFTTVRRV